MTALTDAEMLAIAGGIPAALKAIGYKYFGAYELSEDQWEAVEALEAAATAFPALLDRLAKAEARVVSVGSLTLSEGYGGPQSVAIMQAGGEGGDFPVADVEAALQAFYKANF